jgi:hypothetical protein
MVGVYEETTKSEQHAWLACGPVYMPAAWIGRKTKSPLAHQWRRGRDRPVAFYLDSVKLG